MVWLHISALVVDLVVSVSPSSLLCRNITFTFFFIQGTNLFTESGVDISGDRIQIILEASHEMA